MGGIICKGRRGGGKKEEGGLNERLIVEDRGYGSIPYNNILKRSTNTFPDGF